MGFRSTLGFENALLHKRCPSSRSGVRMAAVGPVTLAKRALVVILRALAAADGARVDVNRESSDADAKKAVRAMTGNVHPDKGGSTEDTQRLLAARGAWLAGGE